MPIVLPGDYVAGLVDGEGCFSLNYRRDVRRERKGSPVYFRWKASFSIVMREDEHPLLESVKHTLGCGDITYSNGGVRYQVQDTSCLQSFVVPYFKKHRLYGKKFNDFNLWSEAVELIAKNKRKAINLSKGIRGFQKVEWDKDDLFRLSTILIEMRRYKSKRGNYKWI
jgi:hypothetical protein